MELHLAELSKSIDPAVLGHRIRNARVAAGLTQTEAADGKASTAYISRIEAGQRRPDVRLLEHLADRLGTTARELLVGVSHEKRDELRLALDYAELALASGSPDEALAQVEQVLADLPASGAADLVRSARYVRASALEATGDLEGAILALEELTDTEPKDLVWLTGLITLSRCYRDCGDLGRAISTGEEAEATIAAQGLDGATEAIQLTLTVAAAHFERGDVSHATRLCQQAIDSADRLDSPMAKASAYWNASVIESRQGNVVEALPLAQKAMALFELGEDARNVARLRTELAILQLRADPPAAQDAKDNLERATRELGWSGASTIDKADNQLALARANLLLGDVATARTLAAESYDIVDGQSPLSAADARVLQGQIAATLGEVDAAQAAYRDAIAILSGAGADRRAAELWFELAGLLEEIGDADAARDAYRRAAASTGLTARTSMHAAVAAGVAASAAATPVS